MTHSTFNPALTEPERLERILVGRHDLVTHVTTALWDAAAAATRPAILAVGPRGMGKSHLVALVHHRLAKLNEGETRLKLAWLEEDPWKIQSYFDLLCAVLRAMAGQAVEDELRRDTKHELHAAERREAEAVRRIEQALGPTAVLTVLVENLPVILDNLGPEGQRKWRALLQNSRRWAILATAPALSHDLSEYEAPFYGFFQVEALSGLSPGEGLELLRNLAQEDSDERLLRQLERPGMDARVQAVQMIAGGNPRVMVILYDCLRQGTDGRLVDALYKTVDAMTPYYQSLIAERSPQQRKILVLLCESPRPMNVAAIAERCSMTPQTASSQLKQLREDRFVRSREAGRESLYELAEPFLRICW